MTKPSRRQSKSKKLTADERRFAEQYLSFRTDETRDPDSDAATAAALSHLRFAQRRRHGQVLVRVFNPSTENDGWQSSRTIVQTVTDDSPFIIDSLTMQLNSSGHGVLEKIHPVLDVERKADGTMEHVGEATDGANRRESWAQFEIPRVIGRAELDQIKRLLRSTLVDVRLAVRDWSKMLQALGTISWQINERHGREAHAFLNWLADDHFTLIAYCCYRREGRGSRLVPEPSTGLGLLRKSRGLQDDFAGQVSTGRCRALTITKSEMRSPIHRPAPLDDIRANFLDDSGHLVEQHCFLGLFTSITYNENPADIPLLRRKIRNVMLRSGLDPVSHRGKALRHVLDTFPRDELLQASEADLRKISVGILNLEERRQVRLFYRKDPEAVFASCLVYVPRDQYSALTRQRIEALIEERVGGPVVDSQLTISESTLARLAITIRPPAQKDEGFDLGQLQTDLEAAATPWTERVRNCLLDELAEEEALGLHNRLTAAFPVAYQEAMLPERAVRDIAVIRSMLDDDQPLATDIETSADRVRFSLFNKHAPVALYLTNPILEHMGLKVVRDDNYELDFGDFEIWIQDFELMPSRKLDANARDFDARFRECFVRTLMHEVENDGFNSLIPLTDLDWREINLLRAYCRYLLQSKLRFSQTYMLETLLRSPLLARAIVDSFASHFDPGISGKDRERLAEKSAATIKAELDRAMSLDDDRILRAFVSVARATLRTNYFQPVSGQPKTYLSFKLDPSKIPDLPRPRPMFEIFVYSQRVEGVHLRAGRIARGGLRWSDRREDFRTEVLGLMKAQQVKNTVIVPSGAKGGFVCKTLPDGDRSAVQQEVIECYKTFIRGLLDVTDNIVDEKTVTPADVLPKDGPDPYLVVAADKGTASFSDIANELSAEYQFWLGDAFASGGSAGYDHKKMAITARGAWESVKRHFREIGVDVQAQEFTVAGIGDMAGDVFGNGMLLSQKIKLVAAFNHQHIFVDPDPDVEASYGERKRLFELPRSSWADYDRSKLSNGGDIFERDAKSIRLSEAAREALGIEQEDLTPPELIQAILRAPVDLLWNGGIGTYVKAETESNMDAGDPANDVVRVDGNMLRCKVVGEGGNLGLTQLGRVEYACRGGRINTDFIDNSGGVDSSDREVNIKILLNDAIKQGVLAPQRRNALLARMTDTVADLVLASNYAQTQALSMMVLHAKNRVGEHERLIQILESRGLLDRKLEYLPSDDEIETRRLEGEGLTRPELAIILSYAKIELFDSLVATDIPDEEHCRSELAAYFPKQLKARFGELMQQHRLRREIVAMLIASSMINRMGPFFMLRAQEETGANAAQVARAYAIIRALFDTRRLWRDIEALDGEVHAQVQYDSFFQVSRMVRRAVYWFLHRHGDIRDIGVVIARLEPKISRLRTALPDVLCGLAKRRHANDCEHFESIGLPRSVGQRIAACRLMTQLLDIAELANEFDADVETVGSLHFELGRGLRFDWIREQVENLAVEGRWSAMARGTLRETLGRDQRALVANILRRANGKNPSAELNTWLTEANARISRMKRTFDEMQQGEQLDFATLSIALRELGRLV